MDEKNSTLILQVLYERGEISEDDLTEQEKEQLCELYEKQCKDIENDTRKTLRKLSMTFFEIIANTPTAKHTKT